MHNLAIVTTVRVGRTAPIEDDLEDAPADLQQGLASCEGDQEINGRLP